MRRNPSRRQFLKTTAIGAGTLLASETILLESETLVRGDSAGSAPATGCASA